MIAAKGDAGGTAGPRLVSHSGPLLRYANREYFQSQREFQQDNMPTCKQQGSREQPWLSSPTSFLLLFSLFLLPVLCVRLLPRNGGAELGEMSYRDCTGSLTVFAAVPFISPRGKKKKKKKNGNLIDRSMGAITSCPISISRNDFIKEDVYRYCPHGAAQSETTN
jgi:hypothetical protein